MSDGIRCMWMRGGTSKGGFFLASDLPSETEARNRALLSIMGSPDVRQIDGMGGGDPLTSKVAVVRPSDRPGIDVEYLFLQVFVDQALVSDAQNCGNMLAGVAPFAIERGLVSATPDETKVSIFMENSGEKAIAHVRTPDGRVTYAGKTKVAGVPGAHAPISVEFCDVAGSKCGALLPTGRASDVIRGVPCTLIDNGMPCIVIDAASLGISGYEEREALEANGMLKERIEKIRINAGQMMNLGDVRESSVPKVMIVAPPRNGGLISVRSFIPHRVHASIGVLGGATVATACLLADSVASELANIPDGPSGEVEVEHLQGAFRCKLKFDEVGIVRSVSLVRTARKLMDGTVFT